MARIIGDIGSFDKKSGEERLFNALCSLNDNYYVIHSHRVTSLYDGHKLDDAEADFLVFNPDLGCLVIEAKNGRVYCDNNGQWRYQTGDKMKNPFHQAFSNVYKILNNKAMENRNGGYSGKIKFIPCVWFPAYSDSEIQLIFKDVDFSPFIIGREALINPKKYIDNLLLTMNRLHIVYNVIEYNVGAGYQQTVHGDESLELFKNCICPTIGVVESHTSGECKYIRLLKEQMVALDFLSEQRTAAINGAGGTGKTLLAIEHARRVSSGEERTLFLCYNVNLKKHLEKTEGGNLPYVDFQTIDSFACSLTENSTADYALADSILKKRYDSNNFQYKHIVIDEAQDFDVGADQIIKTFFKYSEENDGHTCFAFFDKNQKIQANNLAECLKDADSKITLYKNCRNTKKIASFSMKLLGKTSNHYPYADDGDGPFVVPIDSLNKTMEAIVKIITSIGPSNLVIITMKSLSTSSVCKDIIKLDVHDYLQVPSFSLIPIFTVRTFKGLESKKVILIDVTKKDFLDEDKNCEFYVGSSRAMETLYCVTDISQEDAVEIISKRCPNSFKKDDKVKQLSLSFNAKTFKLS